MKKSFLMITMLAMLLACSDEPGQTTLTVNDAPDATDTVTIRFDIPPLCEQRPMTRGSQSDSTLRGSRSDVAGTRSTLADAAMTDLWVMDFAGDELVQTIHQSSTDDGFGIVAVTTETGSHTFCFVASRGTDATLDGGVITWAKPSDTFWHSVTMDVTPQTSTAQSVELQRVATRLRIVVTDEVPATLSTLKITAASWHAGLNAKTGQPTAAAERVTTISVPSSYIGTTGTLTASVFGLCGDDYTTDVTVQALDASSGEIAAVALADVPIKRNTVTQYSGPLFSRQPTFTLTAADGWSDDIILTW